MGSTQAGKSSLIQHIKSYAYPGYVMNETLLGNSIASKTERTQLFKIISNLPVYKVTRRQSGEEIDVNGLATRYQDEEDYRDALLSHPDEVAINEAPNAHSKHLEFQFLDTPGLNSTNGRDSEYAANIVKDVISIRSFNLIVFVISSKNPLTEEKQLALEYYAFVLRGLHSRIVFLYTHVDYAEMHHSNPTYHLNMTMRHKTLCTIFRRHAENSIGEYPRLTIDLVTRKKPVIQCLIRNSIQELLKMATETPMILDTSTDNIKRIRSIKYPAIFNHDQRKQFENQLREGSQQAPNSRQSIKEKPQHSVLVLGKTQSGKSALIEHIKNYANPTYFIDTSLVGRGNVSKTDITRPFNVRTNLPIYEAYRKDTWEIIDPTDLATKCEDEEDYHDILSSRERDVGLRTKPEDPSFPSDTIELQFLDTPGLNDTNDRDSTHAVNIISEMINTRSFNLIIIVVSFMGPLTMDTQLALEYYANVFRGLHSRIVFLYTHVDYADVHHTNTTHHLNMKMKNKLLSKIFRRHDNETVFDEENVKEYPSLTIDLVSKKRPIINCLIRNTIRKLLQMATAPPAVLDTSLKNIERVLGIAHPSKFSDEQRLTIKARFLAEEQKDEPPAEVGEVNILVIGGFQSGKSALIETFKLYANPEYVATTEYAPQDDVKVTPILANLYTVPIHKIRGNDGGYDVVDIDAEATKPSKEDFRDLLNLRPDEVTAVIDPPSSSTEYKFNIYEGPSLNESAEDFEKNIFSIHRTLVESGQKFHQVLFTLAQGDISEAIGNTIRICSDILSDLRSVFSIVHTKVDYSMLHISNKQFHDAIRKRLDFLELHTQSKATSYLIDCNVQSDGPVQRAKTNNVVRDILFAAAKQKPVAVKSPLMKKTPKMVVIDSKLKWLSQDPMRIKNKISAIDDELLKLRNRIHTLCIDYKDKDQSENGAWSEKELASRDDIEVVHEDEYTAEAESSTENEASTETYHLRTMTCKKLPRIIEKVHLDCKNVKIEQVLGGEGFHQLEIHYCRASPAAASLVVKLYSRKLDDDGKPVGETEDMTAIRHRRADLEKKLDVVDFRSKDLEKEQNDLFLLRYCIFRETLPQAVMGDLVKDVVPREPIESVIQRTKEVYLKSEVSFGSDPYAADPEVIGATDDTGSEFYKEYSILMFGKTQAGKSTFIEFVKNYADQLHNIDDTLIGNGVRSKTAQPTQFFVRSHLPSYKVLDSNGVPIDIDNLAEKYVDADDYFDALNDRKVTLKAENGDPDSRKYFIKFLDTPGIEDTDGKDTTHAPKIIHEMARMRTFNLIVIIVNCKDHPSISQQLSFDYYSKVIQVLQGHHDNIVFVYTHVDYVQCHHSNSYFNTNMKLRHEAFSRLFRGCGKDAQSGQFTRTEVQGGKGTKEFPMFTIDLNRSHRPIPRSMGLKTLRDILTLAVKSPPVPLVTMMKNLLRVYGISHPDELNVIQRGRLLKPVRAILEQRTEMGDAPVTESDVSMARGDDSNGVGNEDNGADQSICGYEDCEEYFRKEDLSDFSALGDKGENSSDFDCVDSSTSMDVCSERLSPRVLDREE
ncbi:hypothetical protein CPC16_001726 [Podila verticillata]|nr:hypothetical protein CPC16_001726 [Podila verticillata]